MIPRGAFERTKVNTKLWEILRIQKNKNKEGEIRTPINDERRRSSRCSGVLGFCQHSSQHVVLTRAPRSCGFHLFTLKFQLPEQNLRFIRADGDGTNPRSFRSLQNTRTSGPLCVLRPDKQLRFIYFLSSCVFLEAAAGLIDYFSSLEHFPHTADWIHPKSQFLFEVNLLLLSLMTPITADLDDVLCDQQRFRCFCKSSPHRRPKWEQNFSIFHGCYKFSPQSRLPWTASVIRDEDRKVYRCGLTWTIGENVFGFKSA